MLTALRVLKEKIGSIERHYCDEMLNKLKQLRKEVQRSIDGKKERSKSELTSVDEILVDIGVRVQSVVRQRANLQLAVN